MRPIVKMRIGPRMFVAAALAAALLWLVVPASGQGPGGQPPLPPVPAVTNGGPGVEAIEGEVLTRGPLHEAYAEVIQYNPQAGVIVPKAPPLPIEELPPEEQPEGEGFLWIGGYWWWDEELEDFIWLSGVWRRPPPGFLWVPGYWREVATGYQRVSGYWAPGAVEAEANQAVGAQVEYLPAPPQALEAGPSSPQPSIEYFWAPGCWVWYGGRYAWRTGYWARGYEGWVWIPPRYVWTPYGYVFVPGHWDFAVARRGLIFAPVHFGAVVYTRPLFYYRPRVVIHVGRLHAHLFLRLGHGHYYFGDYYAPRYVGLGFHPWFEVYSSRRAWEPFYAYQHWHFTRHDPAWPSKVRNWHATMIRDESVRPPHTFRAMTDLTTRRPDLVSSVALAARLDQLPDRRPSDPRGLFGTSLRLEPVAAERRQQLTELNTRFRELAQERSRLEQRGLSPRGPDAVLEGPRRIELPTGRVEGTMRPLTRDLPRAALPDRPTPSDVAPRRPDLTPPRTPGGTPSGPAITPRTPGGMPSGPAFTPRTPGGTPSGPAFTPRTPGGTPSGPAFTPRTPGGTPNGPAITPRTPGGMPSGPAFTPRTPGGTPSGPAFTPRTPGGTPSGPAFTPRTPGGTPSGPAFTPRTPGGMPSGPAFTPRTPGGMPSGPAFTPRMPAGTPSGPAITPRVPAGTPSGPAFSPRRSSGPAFSPRMPSGPAMTPRSSGSAGVLPGSAALLRNMQTLGRTDRAVTAPVPSPSPLPLPAPTPARAPVVTPRAAPTPIAAPQPSPRAIAAPQPSPRRMEAPPSGASSGSAAPRFPLPGGGARSPNLPALPQGSERQPRFR